MSAIIGRGLGALAAFAVAGAFAVPAYAHANATTPADAYPSPQAIAANAEFLSTLPAPPGYEGAVCVIDTGVTPLPDLGAALRERIALDGGTPDDVQHTDDDPFSGHGSFVASTIASAVDGRGTAGIWPAAKVISVRVFRPGQPTSAGAYMGAIGECLRPGRDTQVINLSLGGLYASQTDLDHLHDRIADARSSYGVDVVAAAGNNAAEGAIYPARFPEAFAIGATDGAGERASFSNYGAGVDLYAPGENVRLASFGPQLAAYRGTSFAAPVTSGILAALRAYRPDLTPVAAEQLLISTARHRGAGPVLDAAAAFRAAGLGALVDAYQPPQAVQPISPSAAGFLTEVSPWTGIADEEAPARPKLVRASLKGKRLRVQVRRPARRSVAVFRVGGRTYRRGGGVLTLRVRSWRPVTVFIEDAWGMRSAPLKVRHPSRRAERR